MSTPLEISWGKFRNQQRTLPEDERLTRPQMQGAWAFWRYATTHPGDPEKIAIEAAQGMLPEEIKGMRAFGRWITQNYARLAATVHVQAAGGAQTTDGATAQLVR